MKKMLSILVAIMTLAASAGAQVTQRFDRVVVQTDLLAARTLVPYVGSLVGDLQVDGLANVIVTTNGIERLRVNSTGLHTSLGYFGGSFTGDSLSVTGSASALSFGAASFLGGSFTGTFFGDVNSNGLATSDGHTVLTRLGNEVFHISGAWSGASLGTQNDYFIFQTGDNPTNFAIEYRGKNSLTAWKDAAETATYGFMGPLGVPAVPVSGQAFVIGSGGNVPFVAAQNGNVLNLGDWSTGHPALVWDSSTVSFKNFDGVAAYNVNAGTVTGTTVTSSGNVNGVAGVFSGAVSGTTVTGTGAGSFASVSSSGDVSGTTGTFSNVVTETRNNITTVPTDGITIQNTTAATSGSTVQFSPRLTLTGKAWDGAASNTDSWTLDVEPTATTTTFSKLKWKNSLSGGSPLTVVSGGPDITIGGFAAFGSAFAGFWMQGAPTSTNYNFLANANQILFNVNNTAASPNNMEFRFGNVTHLAMNASGIQINGLSNTNPTRPLEIRDGARANVIYTLSDTGIQTLTPTTAVSRNSGFGTNADASFAAGSTAYVFDLDIGTGGTPTTGVINMPAATHGWICNANNATTAASVTHQTAYTTNTVTLTATAAWNAHDHILTTCSPF